MEIGIIGLPFSGKTTLFTTLTGIETTSSHATGRVEVHRGVVKVPDSRLDKLADIFQSEKKVNTTIEYVEVGGLEKEAARGKGFDPQFLTVLKTTDALCHVIRAFEDDVYPHPEGSIDPVRDIQIVETEFILSDLSIIENRISKLKAQIQKRKSDEDVKELELMERCRATLEEERPLRELEFTEAEKHLIRGYQFLSAKPILVVVNYGENDIPHKEKILSRLSAYQTKTKVEITGLSAKVELEISQLDDSDSEMFLQEMNIDQPALIKMIHQSYRLLNLVSFFTFTKDECRAWTVERHTPVQKAAGVIHTDMERGFIRAEVVNYQDFIQLGSMAKCREKGILRLEGKDYIVQDGDIITIRFNV